MDGWNTIFLLGRPIFRGYVSFRQGNYYFTGRLVNKDPYNGFKKKTEHNSSPIYLKKPGAHVHCSHESEFWIR